MTPETEAATQAVIAAWMNPGNHPEHHQQWKTRLRQDWPALASALDRLTATR